MFVLFKKSIFWVAMPATNLCSLKCEKSFFCERASFVVHGNFVQYQKLWEIIRYLSNYITTSCFIRSVVGENIINYSCRMVSDTGWMQDMRQEIMRDHGVDKVISFTIRFIIGKIDIEITNQKY